MAVPDEGTVSGSFGHSSNSNSDNGNSDGSKRTTGSNTENYDSVTNRNEKLTEEQTKKKIADSSMNKLNDEKSGEVNKNVNIYIAEKSFSISLYNLFMDTSSQLDLSPEFLRDFMILPEELFTINAAAMYSRFFILWPVLKPVF